MNKIEFMQKVQDVEETSSFNFILLNNYQYSADNSLSNIVLTGEKQTLHIGESAYPQFLARIGMNCPTFLEKGFVGKNNELVSNLINKVLDEDKECYSMAYIRNGEMLACHSKDYKHLYVSELVDALEQNLIDRYSKVDFMDGYYSDAFTIVDYEIKDKSVVQAYQKFFGNNNNFFDAKMIVRLVTSHLGLSGANIYPMFVYKSTPTSEWSLLPITEKRITLKHEGSASIEAFEKNVRQIFPMVEMLPTQLERLNNITIDYPTHCVINLAEKVGIPAKRISPIAENVSFVFAGAKPTAKEIFLQLSEVSKLGASEVEKMQLVEKVAKALRIIKENLDDVDIPKTKWKRLGILCDEGQDFIPDSFGPQLSFEGVV